MRTRTASGRCLISDSAHTRRGGWSPFDRNATLAAADAPILSLAEAYSRPTPRASGRAEVVGRRRHRGVGDDAAHGLAQDRAHLRPNTRPRRRTLRHRLPDAAGGGPLGE